MPKVSVIVPLYKTEKYMDKCIESVLNQTLKDIEIILVNDGSPDNSRLIAEEYKKVDRRIKIINKENGGLSTARNAGLEMATGEFVAFIDSDDWIELSMIETMYNKAKENKSDLVVCNYNRIYETHIEKDFLKIEDEIIDINIVGLNEYLYRYHFQYIHGDEACNKLFKRSIIENNKIRFEKNSEIFSEDKLFNLYFILHAQKITSIKRSFYNYLQRTGSIMNSLKPNILMQYTNLVEKFIKYTQLKKKYKEMNYIFPVLYAELLTGSIYTLLYSGINSNELKKLIKEASKKPYFKVLMLKLFLGKAAGVYCNKTGKSKKKQITMRVLGFLNFVGFYGVVSKIMISKNKITD